MPFSASPFKDAVQPTAGPGEKPNLGSQPDAPTAGKTGESIGGVNWADLPQNDLHHGTPDKSHYNG